MASHKLNIKGLKIAQFEKAYTLNEVTEDEIQTGDVVILYDDNDEPLTYNGSVILVVTDKKEETVSGDKHTSLTIVPYTPTKVATKSSVPPFSHPFDREEDEITAQLGLESKGTWWRVTSMNPTEVEQEVGDTISLSITPNPPEPPQNSEPNPDIEDETVVTGNPPASLTTPTTPLTLLEQELKVTAKAVEWNREGTDDTQTLSTYDKINGAKVIIKGPRELLEVIPALVEMGVVGLRIR